MCSPFFMINILKGSDELSYLREVPDTNLLFLAEEDAYRNTLKIETLTQAIL
jgi:hypothetical protein